MTTATAETAVSHASAVTAFLGASAGLGGLTLVFLGLVVSSIQGFAPGTAPEVTDPYKRPALTVLAAFAVSLLTCLLAATWLLAEGSDLLYVLTSVAFFTELVLVAAGAVHVLARVVWTT